jgi:hypothetical protein
MSHTARGKDAARCPCLLPTARAATPTAVLCCATNCCNCAGVTAGCYAPCDADILLSCALLCLDQAGSPVDAHNEAACHLGIQGAAVSGLLRTQHAADPRNHLQGLCSHSSECWLQGSKVYKRASLVASQYMH